MHRIYIFTLGLSALLVAGEAAGTELLVANTLGYIPSGTDKAVLGYDSTSGAFQGVFAATNGAVRPNYLLADPGGDLYVAFGFGGVNRYNGHTGAFLGNFVPAGSGGLSGPQGIRVGPDGNFYVVNDAQGNVANSDVLRYNGTTGAFIDAFVAPGILLGNARDLVWGPDGNLYVSEAIGSDVLRFNGTTGTFMDAFIPSGSGGLNDATFMEFGPDGKLYISSTNNSEVLRYNATTGAFIDTFIPSGSGGLNAALGLKWGPDGNLYVSSGNNNEVLRYNGTTGAFIDVFVPSGSGGLKYPNGIAFVPEPGGVVLAGLGSGLLLVLAWRRRRRPR